MPSVLSKKRPASQTESTTSAALKKRPAAKLGSVNQCVEKLKKGWEDEEDEKTLKTKKAGAKKNETKEDDENDEEQQGEDGLRDKGKAVKFNQMRKSLPAHILQLYDEEAQKKTSPRAFRTQIVNALFEKLPNGRYEMKANAPLFEEAKRMYENRYGKQKETGYPRSVMRGLYFANSEPDFKAALEAGDIYRIEEDGKEFFAFASVETGRVRPTVTVLGRGGNHVFV